MKKTFIFAIVMIAFSTAASAQFMNSGSTTTTTRPVTVSSAAVPEVISTMSASYISASMLTAEEDDTEEETFDGGFGIAIEKAKKISTTSPLYFGYGLGISYIQKKDKAKGNGDESYTSKMSFFSGKIPVSLQYYLTLPGTEINILPFAGLNAYYHLSGKQSVSYHGETESASLFDEDEVGIELKRFNIGWTLGAKVLFNGGFVGINYESPLVYLYEEDDLKMGIKQTAITLGIVF